MFEGAIAAFLNRLLGRYVEDLDAEQFNVGIFSGDTCLTDLKLKPEALYQLGLPIRVEIGSIGKIVLKIPWSGLFSQPIVLCIEDIYAVAVPAAFGPYDAEVQKRLSRAEKKKILEDLKEDETFRAGLSPELFDGLLASITKNFQIAINNVHIRYEEKLPRGPLCACGICIQSISITTTNNKWKPGICGATNSQTSYQLVRAESLSVYMDDDAETSLTNNANGWDMGSFLAWRNTMYRSLQTFGLKNKEFQFLLKPFTAKVKIIVHKGNETQPSRMLVDIVLQDIAMQISESQYITFCRFYDSLARAVINRPFRKFRPEKTVHGNPQLWWNYAYRSVVEHYVKPYFWANLTEHRKNYRKYKEAYIQYLLRPNDAELKLDLQKYEDQLTILNIVIAREHARQELKLQQIEQDHRNSRIGAINVSDKEQEKSVEKATHRIDSIRSMDEEDKKVLQCSLNDGLEAKIKLEKLLRPIDYKINFTLANCCLSLLKKTDKEVLVATMTQFLTSIEARPTASAFKVSARAESFVIEGVSSEGDLVPLIMVDNVLTGNVSTNFLAIDFEKRGVNVDPVFDVAIKLEAIEVTYHHHAAMEIVRFFEFDDANAQNTISRMYETCERMREKFWGLVDSIVSQTLRIGFKIDIKIPYIVFPEHESIQRGGHVLILDLGNVIVTNELQAINLQLEDATIMELEELLYDRLHVTLSGAQILFCHSGDDWRSARRRKDSEFHFLPKLQANATLSYSIRPEYHQLPRTKLSVSVSSIKFNLSERKLRLFSHFLRSFLTLYYSNIETQSSHLTQNVPVEPQIGPVFASAAELAKVRSNLFVPSVPLAESRLTRVPKQMLTNEVPKLDRSVVSSEVSEEDLELLSKTINLSGFDDNVSPCNHVNLLLRFAIGETDGNILRTKFSVHLGYMEHGREVPYLNLRLHTLYLEAAAMEYGPAFQFGVGSVLLVDKTDAGITGSYLELISTDEPRDVLVISYRKVRSNCPDFKSHFKNIERSLMISLLNVNLNFHRSALLKIRDRWNSLKEICDGVSLIDLTMKIRQGLDCINTKEDDPPIPPGAIKLNYSVRLGTLTLRLCDKDSDLIEIKIHGLENDCIYNANERMVLRAYLRSLRVEDPNDDTLYAKILTADEDDIFDLKYVRHAPRLYVCSDIDTSRDDVMSDGTFKLTVRKMNCVLLSKVLRDLEHFLAPFTASSHFEWSVKYLTSRFYEGVEDFKRSATKLHIFIDFQGPTFLLPQKKDIPNLLVLDTGILSVENFFKKNGQTSQSVKTNGSHEGSVIDNILLKLKAVTVSRAIMTLSRDLEVQEPIIEPIQVHFDIKRKTEYRNTMEFQTYGLSTVQGSIDFVHVNLSQRDLRSIMSVWRDNVRKFEISKRVYESERRSSMLSSAVVSEREDVIVKKLEDFLSRNETASCSINVQLTFEGLQLNLFLDSEEVLSSPVRDLNHGLCRLSFGEVISRFEFFNDRSLQMKLSLQSCVLQDTRKDASVVKKILQTPVKSTGMSFESCVSVSMSPIVDITFNRAPAGDRCLDILIQETRINLSVPFLMHLTRYLADSLPSEQIEEGIINCGYESNDRTECSDSVNTLYTLNRAQYFKEQPGASTSVRIRKPEILLFGEAKGSGSHVILIEAEVTIESNRQGSTSSIVSTLTNVRVKSRNQKNYMQRCSYWLLRPCDVEISRKEDSLDRTAEIEVVVSPIDIRLSPEVIYTFVEISNEATDFLNDIGLKPSEGRKVLRDSLNIHSSNLWIPKKISSVPYKRTDDGKSELGNEDKDRVVDLYWKPTSVRISLETECSVERLPAIRMDVVIALTVNDWYNDFRLESSTKIHAFCYNANYRDWEPLIELCTKDDVNYKPWELTVKMHRGDAYAIDSNWTEPCYRMQDDGMKIKKKDARNGGPDIEDMTFIMPDHVTSSSKFNSNLYSECEDDSDTDEDESHKKLARTFNYLFDDSSEEEDTDTEDSSANEDEGLELTPECNVERFNEPINRTPVKSGHRTATYIIVRAEEKLDLTITPNAVAIANKIADEYLRAKHGIPIVPAANRKLILVNDIGHASRVELLVQKQVNGKSTTIVVTTQACHGEDSPVSPPSSPEEIEAPSGPGGPSAPSPSGTPLWIGIENEFAEPEEDSRDRPEPPDDVFHEDSPVKIYGTITDELLRVVLEGFDDTLIYCPKKQARSLIFLRPVRHNVRYHLVVEATIDEHHRRTITVRSPLQFKNETSYALGLYYKKSLLTKLGLERIGEPTNPFDDNVRLCIVEPDSTYNVPLYVAYHFPIHVLPIYLEKYQISEDSIHWKELDNAAQASKEIYCKRKTENDGKQSVFGVKVIRKEVPISVAGPSCQLPNYSIIIMPSLILDNRLPFVIDVSVPDVGYEVKIEPGERIDVHFVNCTGDVHFVVKVQNYLGAHWTGAVKMNANSERKLVLMSTDSESDLVKSFPLCIESHNSRTWNVILRAQYWMINKSGLPLFIQDCHSHLTYEMPGEELMVFSRKSNKRNAVRVRAHQSEWSPPFGLDGVLSTSLIVCRDLERGRKYRILTEIENSRLSSPFTKIVTFLPYFLIANRTKKTLRFMEENDEADLWNDLLPGQEIPFWPATDSMKMRVKWKNSQLVSQRFDITCTGKTVLRMDNGSALSVNIEGGADSPYYLTFRRYVPGDAPVRIDNLCDELFLKINQTNLGQATLINPFRSLLYTWDDPTKARQLLWNVYNAKGTGYVAQFETDGFGQERVCLMIVERHEKSFSQEEIGSNEIDEKKQKTDETTVYWVSYMEGKQRVLLFTRCENIYLKAKAIIEPEPSKRETFLSLAGIGISAVAKTNGIGKELAHASIMDSAGHWELYFGKSWRSLSLELSTWIENKYANSCKRAQLQNFIDIDLVKMHMTKPFFGKLRRTYSPGIWLHRRESDTLVYMRGHIHRIQLDNQLADATFPVVLSCRLQRNIVNYAGNRRFKHNVEFVCLKRHKPQYTAYKGICILIRELDLNLEESFLLSLIDLVPKRPETKHSIATKLRKDVANIHALNFDSRSRSDSQEEVTVIERIFISPISIKLRLLANAEGVNAYDLSDIADRRNTIKFIFEYAEDGFLEKHAEFRLPAYQRNFVKSNDESFFSDLLRIYAIQITQQFYVLIRSIVVVGNRHGYNFKFSESEFDEPDSFLICTDDTSEKLYQDAACQIGATTDSTSNQRSEDQESYIFRGMMKEMYYRNADVPPPIFTIDKRFSAEIELETSGLINASSTDASREELKYLLKTMGRKTSVFFKLETAPSKTCTKIILDAIRRAQETGHGFYSRVRLPRHVNPCAAVESYSAHKAKGTHLLNAVNRSHCARTDTYWAHTNLSVDGKYVALISLQRIYLIEKGLTWGSWNVKWSLDTLRLFSPPTVTKDRLVLHVDKNEESSDSAVDWYLKSTEPEILEWLARKINTAMIVNMECGVCSKEDL